MQLSPLSLLLFSIFFRQSEPLELKSLPLELLDLMKVSTQKCFKSSGASAVDIEDCREGRLPSDEPFKCFVTCVLRSYNFMNHRDELVPMNFGIPEVTEALRHCATERGTNHCDSGYKFSKCLLDKLDIYDEICYIAA